jgi:hypothetical protein
MGRVPNVTQDTLTDFVLGDVTRHSEARTDGWQGDFVQELSNGLLHATAKSGSGGSAAQLRCAHRR